MPVFPLVLFFSISIVPLFAQAADCPVINGTFRMDTKLENKIVTRKITHFTRQVNGIFSYTIDAAGNFQEADGVPRSIRIGNKTGKITFSCMQDTLILITQADGSEFISRTELAALSDSELEVKSNVSGRSGLYSKE